VQTVSLTPTSVNAPNAVILRFLADFDEVSFSVAEFEDLRVATVLDWSHENAATGKLFVRFL
jgi:predicted DNA-binding protein (UPF0251 family)